MTIVIDGDYAIGHGQTLNGNGIMFRLEQTDESRPTTFDNAGKIVYRGAGGMMVQTDNNSAFFKSFVFNNAANGVLDIWGGSSLVGFSLRFQTIDFNNAGRFQFSSGGIGIGVLAQGSMQFDNTGAFTVQAPNAVGVASDFGHIANDGEMTVSGQAGAIGLRLNDHGAILNSGDLTVSATGGAIGVVMGADEESFANTGRIEVHADQADKAVGVQFDAFTTLTSFSNTGAIVSNGFALFKPDDLRASIGLDIANDGTIKGDVSLGRGDDHFANRGGMTGDVLLGDGDDVFLGAKGLLVGQVFGGDGDDLLIGGKHADMLNGDSAGAGKHDGSDQIDGGKGDDILSGDGGADGLTGGKGADVLTGGSGADSFLFSSMRELGQAGHADLITDLAAEDFIDLSRIDADVTQAGNQAFVLAPALDGHAGQAAFSYDAGSDLTTLSLDVDGDGQADGVITITGDHRDFAGVVL